LVKKGYVDINLPNAVKCNKMCKTCEISPTNCTKCRGNTR